MLHPVNMFPVMRNPYSYTASRHVVVHGNANNGVINDNNVFTALWSTNASDIKR